MAVVDDCDMNELVPAALSGDQDAWREIVRCHERLIWHIIRSFRFSDDDVDDIYATVLLKLAEQLHKVRNPESLGFWLGSVTRNECSRRLRPSQTFVEPADLDERVGVVDGVESEVERHDDRVRLLAAIQRLSENCRAVIALRFFGALKFREIEAAMGHPTGWAGPTLRRCLDRIRDDIGTELRPV